MYLWEKDVLRVVYLSVALGVVGWDYWDVANFHGVMRQMFVFFIGASVYLCRVGTAVFFDAGLNGMNDIGHLDMLWGVVPDSKIVRVC